MAKPTLTDYVRLMFTLFDRFEQHRQANNIAKPGRPFTFVEKAMVVLFTLFQFRRFFHFKAQRRWLAAHTEMLSLLQMERVPHRITFSRRYKQLYETIQVFVAFTGHYAAHLDPAFSQAHLVEDKSLCKAAGPVRHQSDRRAGRMPDKLRHLDTDATWGKSDYQGWVYGYGLHITCNEAAFPSLLQVASAAYPESDVLDAKANHILNTRQPVTVAVDNKYTNALPIRDWARQGVALLPPALKWVKGRLLRVALQDGVESPVALPLDSTLFCGATMLRLITALLKNRRMPNGCAVGALRSNPSLIGWPRPWAQRESTSNDLSSGWPMFVLAWRLPRFLFRLPCLSTASGAYRCVTSR